MNLINKIINKIIYKINLSGMSEENTQNNISIDIESHQNSSGENRRGAPVRTQPIIKQNFWFYDKDAI